MASVTSLDHDMRNLRLGRYTPQAANEVRTWIESVLGEQLPPGDLLQVLKDGTVLCRLANLATPPPGIKFKKSAMPFIQMENVSHFLRACEAPPLNMHAHDRFLTVDLYEAKDPAQVLQCLQTFSRVANAIDPGHFPTCIGPQKKGASTLSPSTTGAGKNGLASPGLGPLSPALTGGSNASSTASSGLKSSKGTVSSWSNKSDVHATSPAWNIAQYGYMGGASQGNQGVAFGARRQITTAAPHVPSLADKERKRKEKEVEDARLRQQAEEAEHKRKVEREAEEERERIAEEEKWEQETRRVREEERKRIEEQKRQWEEQERRWKVEEDARLKEEAEAASRSRATSDARLKGQFLSQYQAEQAAAAATTSPRSPKPNEDTPERRRVRELEKQLEEAKERERQYQIEREGRTKHQSTSSRSDMPPPPDPVQRPPSPKDSEASWAPGTEREFLQKQWDSHQEPAGQQSVGGARPLPLPGTSTRPLPEPTSPPALPSRSTAVDDKLPSSPLGSPRPLPKPTEYKPYRLPTTRVSQYLAEHPAPEGPKVAAYQPAEMGYTSTYEEQQDKDRRIASQQQTKAGGWASKSLLEREMERERERQREWESAQEALKNAPRDPNEGSGPGQTWSTAQYGYMGGDSQNKGSGTGSGIAIGGRRQIIGPRPPK